MCKTINLYPDIYAHYQTTHVLTQGVVWPKGVHDIWPIGGGGAFGKKRGAIASNASLLMPLSQARNILYYKQSFSYMGRMVNHIRTF